MNWKKLSFVVVALVIVVGAAVMWTSKGQVKQEKGNSVQETLRELGYLDYVEDEDDEAPQQESVTKFDEDKASDGINIFVSEGGYYAYLMDNSGEILHRWTLPIFDNDTKWNHVEMDSEGSIYIIETFAKYGPLVKLDFDSNILWINNDIKAHHDVSIAEDAVYTIGKEGRKITVDGTQTSVACDVIEKVGFDGESISSTNVCDLLKAYEGDDFYKLADEITLNKIDEKVTGEVYRAIDLLHTNTIEKIKYGFGPVKAGDFIFSPNHFSKAYVVDLKEKKIVWSWGGNELFEHMHMPTILEGGKLLFFENGLKERKYSRVIEGDMKTGEVIYEYTADPKKSFYSSGRGSAQMLPNGNILVTESQKGKVFEITPDGETVWEFYNFEREPVKGRRRSIYRMMRLPYDYFKNENFKQMLEG